MVVWHITIRAAGMTTGAEHVVVTPYADEEPALIARCVASVKRQTVRADHLLVADGRAQDWLDREEVRHLRLDRRHADFGNAARGLGALLAVAEGCRSIAFLDADNWFDPDHIERCIAASRSAQGAHHDYVIARRRWVRPDETVLGVPDEPAERHVDTNCFVLFRGAFHMVSVWASMPREVSAIGDRIFYAALRNRGLSYGSVDRPTVNYACLWEYVYRAAGEPPPAGAKPSLNATAIEAWLQSCSDRELEIASRLAGIRLVRPLA